MEISTYASRLQSVANDLANIGYPVDDHDLILQLLDGLDKKFRLHSAIIQNDVLLPSFVGACSRLLLAKLSIASERTRTRMHMPWWSTDAAAASQPTEAATACLPRAT
jgi:hypothetical protein